MALAGVMTKFKIDELSGVDRPAQKGARATIIKRDSGSRLERADPGQDERGVAMSTAIKKALGLADTATDTEVEAAIVKLASGELKEVNAKLAKAESDLALANKIAKMAPPVREHYEALLKADKKKDAEDLADMGADEATEKVKKLASGDETLELHGQTIRKSAVGDGVFAVMKAQAKEIAETKADIAKAREQTAMAGFAKRASEDFSHLAGTTEDRAAVLKFLDGAPAEVKASAEAILKAAEGHAKFAFSRAGAGGGQLPGDDNPEAKLTKLAKEYEKAHSATPGMTFAKAYDAVAQANPQLYEEVINPSAD